MLLELFKSPALDDASLSELSDLLELFLYFDPKDLGSVLFCAFAEYNTIQSASPNIAILFINLLFWYQSYNLPQLEYVHIKYNRLKFKSIIVVLSDIKFMILDIK